jgi:D-2-hydroxyacid dehydrogenase (NADP+)
MKILVDLNSQIDQFNLTEAHKERLKDEFPQHDFLFLESYGELKKKIHLAEAAIVWIFPEKLFSSAGKLKSLYTPAAGKDWVAVDPRGNVETHFSCFHGEMIAESFLAMLLYFNNQLAVSLSNQSLKKWDRNAFPKRRLLKGQSLLILGYGSIGERCGELAESMGMKVTGVSRSKESSSTVKIIHPGQLSGNIKQYDHILNVLPGGELTEGFVSEEFLAQMHENSCFYNFGRGTTVDEFALEEVLSSGGIAFAGLDVTRVEPLANESALWSLDNVLLTPHSSCCYDNYLDLFIDELQEKL